MVNKRGLHYPVLKVGELPSAAATPESSPESTSSTCSAGGSERAPAGCAASAAAEAAHAPSASVPTTSTAVAQRDAEGLRVHPPLLRPGLPALTDINKYTGDQYILWLALNTMAIHDGAQAMKFLSFGRDNL